jgi:DnaJ-class molecular chaperone
MSDENDRCPKCRGEGKVHVHCGGIYVVKCESCQGTGLKSARAGVSRAALVGASGSESEECKNCKRRGKYFRPAYRIGGTWRVCMDCRSKGRV